MVLMIQFNNISLNLMNTLIKLIQQNIKILFIYLTKKTKKI